MKILNIEQGTKEWHEFRKKGIGSSDITILLGSYPFGGKTALTLFEDKTSDLMIHEDNKAMAYGRGEEGKALEVLKRTDATLRAACAIHDEHEFIRCSFDALGEDGFYEIKSPYSLEVLERALMGNLQNYWIDQVRWQILVSGFNKGVLTVWDGATTHNFDIEKDEEWEKNAKEVAHNFWECVRLGQRPEASDEDFVQVDDPECMGFIEQYHSLCDKEKEVKKTKDMLKAQILDKGPGLNFMVGGVKIFQDQITSYDFDKMKKDGINLDQYKKLSHPFWKISPKKGTARTR